MQQRKRAHNNAVTTAVEGGAAVIVDYNETYGYYEIEQPASADDPRAVVVAEDIAADGYGDILIAGDVRPIVTGTPQNGERLGSQADSWEWAVSENGNLLVDGLEVSGTVARARFCAPVSEAVIVTSEKVVMVWQENPDTNYWGSAPHALVEFDVSGGAWVQTKDHRILVRFADPPQVISVGMMARLKNVANYGIQQVDFLSVDAYESSVATLDLRFLTEDFDPTAVTWNTRPAGTPTEPMYTLSVLKDSHVSNYTRGPVRLAPVGTAGDGISSYIHTGVQGTYYGAELYWSVTNGAPGGYSYQKVQAYAPVGSHLSPNTNFLILR